MFGSRAGSTRPRVAVSDEAAHHKEHHWMKKLRALPFTTRMSIIFACSFAIGFAIEVFACKTGLYQAVTHNKMQRRHQLDEIVVELRENIQRWTEEDKRIAAENQRKLQLQEEARLRLVKEPKQQQQQ